MVQIKEQKILYDLLEIGISMVYGKYGVLCKKCSSLVGGKVKTCSCGNIKIRKLKEKEGLVVYADDYKEIGSIVDIYYDSKGNIVKYFTIGPLSVGKAIFIELEAKIKDYKMYHKKLTCDTVIDIITRYLKGETQQSLADEYNISKKEVYNIVYRIIKKNCVLPEEIRGKKYSDLVANRARLRVKEQFRDIRK